MTVLAAFTVNAVRKNVFIFAVTPFINGLKAF